MLYSRVVWGDLNANLKLHNLTTYINYTIIYVAVRIDNPQLDHQFCVESLACAVKIASPTCVRFNLINAPMCDLCGARFLNLNMFLCLLRSERI